MKKKYFIIIGIIVILLLLCGAIYILFGQKKETDAEKFANEYTTVTADNVFVYRSLAEINKILENGTGIVYLGFPECPWCEAYVSYLNEEAKAYGVEKIYYANVLNDRQNNTSDYQKTISLLENYLQYDEEGNKKIYVPSVIAVNQGHIVGFDDETAWDTKGYESPSDYWANEDLQGLRNRLQDMFDKTKPSYCTSGCNQ